MKILQIRHSRKGSALLIGLFVMVLLSILVISFLDKVLRVGKNVKSIEQSTQAYYLATSVVEKQLMVTPKLKTEPWTINGISAASGYSGASLLVSTTNSTVPQPGKGNSPFNKDYNLIGLENPLQIVIPNGVDWHNTYFEFRIPDSQDSTNAGTLQPSALLSSSGAMLWTIGNRDSVLYSDVSSPQGPISFSQIGSLSSIPLGNRDGYYYDPKKKKANFNAFYNTLGSSCDNYKCTLKLSLLYPIPATINGVDTILPFLEYRIRFPENITIPNQFMLLRAEGKVGEYKRIREIRIPQITTNTALDFAVLQ